MKEADATITVENCWELQGCIKQGEDNENLNPNGKKTESEIKSINWSNFTVRANKNNGYPILTWEVNV